MRKELKSYLDMQIKEKMKEKEFEKMLWREQGKIWNLDSEKYKSEQKLLEDKIRMDGLKHGEILRKQIEDNNKIKMKKNSMSSAEYSLNKNEINKIILKKTKDFGSIEKRNDLMKYYIDELQNNKMIDLTKNKLKYIYIYIYNLKLKF